MAPVQNLDDVASFTVSQKAGEFVYRQGDAGKEMFIIQDGRIEILDEYGGRPRRRDLLEPGDFFGELSLLEDEPRDASVRAVTDCRLLRIDRTTLHQLVRENPDIAVRMLHRLASRLREHEDARLKAMEIAAGAMRPMPPAAVGAAPAPIAERGAAPPPAEAAPAGGPPALVHAPSGQRFELPAGRELIVGRIDRSTGFTPDVDLTRLDAERTLSRRHAVIVERDGRYYLRETTPTRNGTFVSGTRVAAGADVELHDGDPVRFGVVELAFEHR
ncbi:MAG: cyclic nucleotide-binding domain-containing protein [Betaproteobacteria bacterium]